MGHVQHREARPTPHLALWLIPLVLLLAIALHQGGMVTFALAHSAGDIGIGAPVIEGRHGDCPGHPAQSRICRATKPFVQRFSLSLVFVALIAAFAAPPTHHAVASRAVDWQWPPNKRRALLQVFLR